MLKGIYFHVRRHGHLECTYMYSHNTHTVTRQYSHADWSGTGSRLPAKSGTVDTYNSNETTWDTTFSISECHLLQLLSIRDALCSVEPNSNQHSFWECVTVLHKEDTNGKVHEPHHGRFVEEHLL